MYMHSLTGRDLEWMIRLERTWRRSYFAELERLLEIPESTVDGASPRFAEGEDHSRRPMLPG